MLTTFGEVQQPLRHVGSASRSLSGDQAKKVVFNGSPSEYFGPLSAKPGLFSAGEPASLLKDLQVLWQVLFCVAGMGMVEDGDGVLVPGLLVLCLLQRCLALFLDMWSLILGTRSFVVHLLHRCLLEMVQRLSWASRCPRETLLSRTFSTVPCPLPAVTCRGLWMLGSLPHSVVSQTRGFAGSGTVRRRRTSSQRGAGGRAGQAVPVGGAGSARAVYSTQCAGAEDIFNGSLNTSSGDVSEAMDDGQPAHSVVGQTCGFAGSGTVRRHRTSSRRGAGGRACAGQAVPGVGAGSACAVHPAQCAGAEAGSDSLANFVASFHSCENHAIRTGRVTAILHAQRSHNSQICNSYSTLTRSLHDVHVARCVHNSMNSLGDRGVRERGFCVPGGTKSLSTCTRTGVRRPAVEKLASPQQASLKLHVETWAGLLKNRGPKIFREEKIIPGCAVRVACPSCPDYHPEPPGPGIVIRNMLGWSKLEKTERSGVWVFRGALQGENLFSLLDAAGDWVKKGSYHTAWAVPGDSSCSCSYAYGHGPAIGPHTGRRCWPLPAGVWRAIAPLMQPWCAEGDLPTAANLNLYRGWKSCVGWHCDDEPLFGKCGDAKLIVSVSLGDFALFRWRRQSCSSNGDSSCRLDHGDILVMDGQCQDEFLHRTSPGREQDRINITFRWVKQHVASCPLFRAGVACCLPTCAQGSFVLVMENVFPGVFWSFLVSPWCLVHMGSPSLAGLPVVYKTWVTQVCLLLDMPSWYCSVGALPL